MKVLTEGSIDDIAIVVINAARRELHARVLKAGDCKDISDEQIEHEMPHILAAAVRLWGSEAQP